MTNLIIVNQIKSYLRLARTYHTILVENKNKWEKIKIKKFLKFKMVKKRNTVRVMIVIHRSKCQNEAL